jgi:hypothetical protein
MNKAREMPFYKKLLIGLLAVIMAGGLFRMIVSFRSMEPGAGPAPGKVWSEEHQHWH